LVIQSFFILFETKLLNNYII